MEKVKDIIKAIQTKQIGVLMTFLMMFLGFVLLSWLAGYWCNGLLGTQFEINSCWQGLGGIVADLDDIAELAGTQYAKYYLDSKYNSAEGESPERSK